MKRTPLKRKPLPRKKTPIKRTGLKRKPGWKTRTYTNKKGQVKKKVNPYWRQVFKTDRLFSVLRRLQEADGQGVVTCFTSGVKGFWKRGKIELGHFRSRGNMSTRWDPMNGWPQSEYDNRVLKGNLEIYRENLVKKFGEKKVKELEKKADSVKKWTLQEMKELRIQFNRLIKELKKQKGL